MSEKTLRISIPSDNDGFCLLKCPTCGEFFKLMPSDCQDEGILDIHCPGCGLIGNDYFTDEVLELAMIITKNYADDLIYNFLKKIEKDLKGGIVSIKAGKKPRPEVETPIRAGIESLAISSYPCCNRKAKVKPLLKITGCYCPFCGVKNYEVE